MTFSLAEVSALIDVMQWIDKPQTGRGRAVDQTTGYLQAILVRDCGATLDVDGLFGPLTETAVRNVQTLFGLPVTGVVDAVTWDAVDDLAYTGWSRDGFRSSGWRRCEPTFTSRGDGKFPFGLAIVNGANRHTGVPVNRQGLTRDAQRLLDGVRIQFPASRFTSCAVDRGVNLGSSWSTKKLSDHARGAAIDLMFRHALPGLLPSAEKRRAMGYVYQWVVDHAAKYRVDYVLSGHRRPKVECDIAKRGEQFRTRLTTSATAIRTHGDHAHISVVS